VKLLSNPSQRFVAAFIGPRLPPSPSPKQFRVEREIEFPRVRINCIGLVGLHHIFYKGAAGPLGLQGCATPGAASPVAAPLVAPPLEPAH
jgi:hypothetical protein